MQNHPEGFNQSVCRKLFEAESNKDDKFSSKEMSIINTAKVYSVVVLLLFVLVPGFYVASCSRPPDFPRF